MRIPAFCMSKTQIRCTSALADQGLIFCYLENISPLFSTSKLSNPNVMSVIEPSALSLT